MADVKRLSQPILVIENAELSEEELLKAMKTGSIGIFPNCESSIRRLDEQGIKSEAIKEFAELVKMEFYKEFDELIPSIMADRIDNLVKEMTERCENG